jgi:hypothetical protein
MWVLIVNETDVPIIAAIVRNGANTNVQNQRKELLLKVELDESRDSNFSPGPWDSNVPNLTMRLMNLETYRGLMRKPENDPLPTENLETGWRSKKFSSVSFL